MKESNFKKAVNEILSFDFSGDGQKAKNSGESSRKPEGRENPDIGTDAEIVKGSLYPDKNAVGEIKRENTAGEKRSHFLKKIYRAEIVASKYPDLVCHICKQDRRRLTADRRHTVVHTVVAENRIGNPVHQRRQDTKYQIRYRLPVYKLSPEQG